MNTSGTNYMLSVHFGSDSVLPQQPGSKTHTKRTRSVATEVPSTRLPVRAGPSSRSLHQASQLQRKPRLPWLDGSQSRKASLPLAPGAFSDNDDDGEKVGHTTSDQLDWPVPTPTRPAPGPHTQHIAPPASGPRLDLPHLPLVAPTQDDSRPAVPLIALARELYKTDTSAAISESDTDRSMRDARRRALQDPSARSVQMSRERSNNSSDPLPAPAPPAVPASSAFRSSRIVKTETPSPSTSSLNRESTVERSSSVDSLLRATIAVDRRGSTSLQPIRSKRVTIAPEDLPPEARLARRQTLSVQPLKSSRLSRSFDDDLSSDVVKTSRGISIASQSPSERDLRNSIAGLESLMQEAVQLAKEAANNGRSEEVPGIMDEARLAMHRATNVPQDQATTRAAKKTRSPVSSSESSSSSSSEELPAAAVPRASHRIPRSGFFSLKDGPTSDQGSIMRASSPGAAQAVWDEDYPNHRLDPPTKPEDPRSIDFALSPAARLVAVAPGVDKGKTREGLQNQQRPPAPTRIPSNPGASKPVLPTREQVREHIQEHLEPPIPPRQSSLANLNNLGVLEGTTSPEIPPTDAAPRTESQSANADPIVSSTLTQRPTRNWGRDKYDDKDYSKTIDLRGKHHFTLREGERFSIHHGHKRQPIARNWGTIRKRFVALVTCGNTALIGTLIGIYAGEVPAIQYPLADLNHQVILGNVWLYIGMAITTFLFWPLPLLHGRKPYTLVALGIALPLQIPQAIIVQDRRRPVDSYSGYLTGLLLCRGLLGLALGFAHMNFKATLLDLFGASLQSEFPHGEVVITDDVRRHGGGMGYWLGIWSFCFLGSLALGFLIGADVISALNQAWGFYICVILIALALFINVLTPETRRSPHRRTMQEVELPNDSISRRVARGEIKMHVNGDGPKWWWEEVFAGVYLSLRMLLQSGFLLMALYMAWIYAQIVLIIVLLGNLLSVEYRWPPEYVGLGVLSVGMGALLAVPNSKANFFSRSRVNPPRTDSMTFQPRFAWTSHLVRRALFMTILPLAGLAYTLASKGNQVNYMVPIVFAALIGYVSNLAIAECNGIIMETFDTSDLQPGTNSRHRLQSLQASVKRRRTTYTSYPRVSAGLFCAQSLGFVFAAAATGVGGAVTRTVGAQKATAITAGILMGLTLFLICALVRFRTVQVIPNELFGQYFGSNGADRRTSTASVESDKSWRAVIIGSPSGKLRKMNWLELGSLSRWTEIRRLNRLLNRSTTQALNPGWQ